MGIGKTQTALLRLITKSISDTVINSIISNVDILSCSDLSSSNQQNIELTSEILDWIGGYDSTEKNKILYHTHETELWKSVDFRSKILHDKLMPSGNLERYGNSDDAPAAARGTMSKKKRADILSRSAFNSKTGWGCRLLKDLGISVGNLGSVHKKTEDAIRQLTVNKPMHDLQDFQKEMVDSIVEKLGSGVQEKRIVHLPTGAGKTRVTVEGLIAHAMRRGSGLNVLWVADSRELCEQAEGTIEAVFSDFGLRGIKLQFEDMTLISYHSGKVDEAAIGSTLDVLDGIVIAVSTPDQANNRINLGTETAEWLKENLHVMVVDEAHEAIDEYTRILDSMPDTVDFLALTATPDSLLISDVFDSEWIWPVNTLKLKHQFIEKQLEKKKIISKKRQRRETVENLMVGYNREQEYYDRPNNLKERNSPFWYLAMKDLILSELNKTNKPSLLVFVDNIIQAKRLSSIVTVELERVGRPETCKAVWGAMHPKSRAKIIRDFVTRDIEIIVNAKLLKHGFDAPLVNTVIIGRNTDPDTPLFKQMIGRGLRGTKFGGTKECRIIRLLP